MARKEKREKEKGGIMEHEKVTELIVIELVKAKAKSKPRIAIVRALFRWKLRSKLASQWA
ncbi:hypothetical protein HZC09_00425 [Candidatus Micrarchaeota archaeon]|nr:hypothetical protein [Candidatus Micrarchaeota archaeon]